MHASEPSTVAREEFPAPIAKFLGLKLLQAKNGRAEVEFVADERHANPAGTPHGGVFCDIADAAMGLAYYTTLEADESLDDAGIEDQFSSAGMAGDASRKSESDSRRQAHRAC